MMESENYLHFNGKYCILSMKRNAQIIPHRGRKCEVNHMQKFSYRIEKDFAIHFGPAGRLANLTKQYPDTTAMLKMGTRSANLSQPMKVATLGVRKDDVVVVTTEGPSEVELADVLFQYFEAAL